jgi:transposase-like protein
MAWTDELKAQAQEMYLEGNPTGENSPELVKEIAEKLEQSPNGVRMVLIQAGVYVKKEATSGASKTKTPSSGEGTKRVSKDAQIAALKELIQARGKQTDEDILGKLTGKAAAYFVEVFKD